MQVGVDAGHHFASFFVQSLLQLRAFRLQVLQDGIGGCERQGMTDEGSSEEGDAYLGERIVAILPHAAVERVHELRLAGQDANRRPPPIIFAVGGHVGANTENGLCTAGMSTEAGHYFVKDKSRTGFSRDFAQFLQEFARLADWDGDSAPVPP